MSHGNEVTRLLLERAAKAGELDAIEGKPRKIVHPRKCIQESYDLAYEKFEGPLAFSLMSIQ